MKLFLSLTLALALSAVVSAQGVKTSKLIGTVYDAQGAVIVSAKVVARAPDGKDFSCVTDSDGNYSLTLPFNKYDPATNFKEARYDITVQSNGFKVSETKGFIFIPSYSGAMHLDIALEIATFVNVIETVNKPQ